MTAVSVIIPTLNAGPEFEHTLDAIREQEGVPDLDLVVVDSESEDDTVRLAREAGARVRRVLRCTFNHGLTRNLGAALARGEFLAFLTQDALPAGRGWLATLVEAARREDAAGCYSRVLPRPGCTPLVERSVRADLVFSVRREVKRATPESIDGMTPFERRVFFHFNNVSSLIRRAALETTPFPDIPFGEDLSWAERILRGGGTLVYEPSSVVFHSHESSWRGDFLRHRQDAVLMRTLFGFRNRDALGDSARGWWQEVRRDWQFLGERRGSWSERLRWGTGSLILRACQIAGQLAGSHDPPARSPRFAASLPRLER